MHTHTHMFLYIYVFLFIPYLLFATHNKLTSILIHVTFLDFMLFYFLFFIFILFTKEDLPYVLY